MTTPLDRLDDGAMGGEVFPLSFAQTRFVQLERERPGGGFNQGGVYTFSGPLDPDLLRRTLEEVVRRQGALRTVITTVNGKLAQVVRPSMPVEIATADIRHLPEEERDPELWRIARRDAAKAMELERGPLFRFRLVRTAEARHAVVSVLHHAISDGWSNFVFYREIAEIYAALAEGRPVPLPELEVQYAELARAERERLTGREAARLAAARARLASAPVVAIRTDKPRPAAPSRSVAVHYFDFARRLVDEMGAIGRHEKGSLHSSLLAAFSIMLARLAGTPESVAGIAIGNREGATETLIGAFLNMLPVRVDLSDDPTFEALVPRVRDAVLDAFERRDIPFEALVAGIPAPAPGAPLPCPVTFVLHHGQWATLEFAGITAQMDLISGGAYPFELTFSIREHPDGASVRVQYDVEVFEPETVRMVGERYVRLLEAIIAAPAARVSTYPVEPLPAPLAHASPGAESAGAGATAVPRTRLTAVAAPHSAASDAAHATNGNGNGAAPHPHPAQPASAPASRLPLDAVIDRQGDDPSARAESASSAESTLSSESPPARSESTVADPARDRSASAGDPRSASGASESADRTEAAVARSASAEDGVNASAGLESAGETEDGAARFASAENAVNASARLESAGETEDGGARSASAEAAVNASARLESAEETEDDGARSASAGDVEEDRVYPQSFAQQRLWFVDRMKPGSPVYNIPRTYLLTGALDVDALRRALREVVARHEALRTVFATVDGAPVQVVRATMEVALPLESIEALPPAARRDEVRRRAEEEAVRPFDLERGPLFRAVLVRLSPGEHALTLAMHHVVSDGWSMTVLFRELAALYDAFSRGLPSPLPPLPMQYAAYTAWQRERLSGARVEKHLAFWRRELDGAPATLGLPTDRPRPAVMAHTGAVHPFLVPKEPVQRLWALSREESASLFMTVLAAFQLLLSRWSGQPEVVVGTPVANRTPIETEPMIGFFVNSLPLRADLSDAPTFRQLLRRVRDTTFDAYGHMELPFERLVDDLKAERSLAHHPVFQVMLALQNATTEDLHLGGVAVERVDADAPTARVDLTLGLIEAPGGGMRAVLEYSTELFEPATAERLSRHFVRLLEGAAYDPDAPVAALPLMDEAERREIVHGWNATATEYPRHATVPALFAAHAAATPHAVALVADGTRLTYGEVERRANRIARFLATRGAREGAAVGVALERSAEAVVAILAVLKAGAAYVPLDPELPSERLGMMAADARCALVVVRDEVPGALRPVGGPVVSLARDAAEIAGMDDAPLAPAGGPESPAYVIFTSGSTGRPKGVVVPHRAIVRLVRDTTLYPFSADDVVLHAAPLGFDASTVEIWGALLNGGRLAVHPAGTPALAELGETIRRDGVTWAWLTAGLFNQVVDARVDDLAGLRQLVTGGEALSIAHVRRALRRIPGVQLVNGYGPTENTTFTTRRVIRPADLERPAIPIGEPLSNTRVYVLDAELRPVAAGVPGELCAAGDGLALGYAGRPELTAERFATIDADGRKERVYRTGDRVRWLPEGTLEFLGRMDGQVKLRGYRIELEEVEAALRRHPSVRDAAAAVYGEGSARSLVAWTVAEDPSSPPDADELRGFVARTLPPYMLPAAFACVDAIPLTRNGKVDRGALPAPEPKREGAAHGAPRTELERRIAAAWAAVLGAERVGVDESFFEIGGNSLLLIALHERMRKEIPEAELALLDFFRHPTVRALAERIGGGERPREEHARGAAAISGKVAVIGMAGRFPGARSVAELWDNLRAGRESIAVFTDQELRQAGVPEALIADRGYVRAAGTMDDVELFDARFFGYSPRDAEIMDPQQRIFLECAWEAMEHAGHAPGARTNVGVYAGTSVSWYLPLLREDAELEALAGRFALHLANDKDFIASRTAYKLGLEGPSVTVQSACSTSLLAVHTAARALLGGECDMALAGGATVRVPQQAGYLYDEGGISSPDGHCRTFDADARGSVGGSGVAVVVLKRLEDALADRDTVHAVILGSAVANDGAERIGFTAPGVRGQVKAIRGALRAAGVAPETIGYVEAHGTATALGDPIEVAALSEAFGPVEAASVALGAVKTNVGHLDAAAGVTGFIKTVLTLEHAELVPTLHYRAGNPKIDFGRNPFQVVTETRPFPRKGGAPLRAGVSAFGMGGTDVHVVLEEAPAPEPVDPSRPWQLMLLSARSRPALDDAAARLAGHLRAHADADLGDVAFTLREGRRAFSHRRAVVVRAGEDAAALLTAQGGRRSDGVAGDEARSVAFLFPGLGDQYPGMGRGLYESEPVFRDAVDRCAALLLPHLGADVREVLYPPDAAPASTGNGVDLRRMLGRAAADPAAERLNRTAFAQPAVFVTEYALAALWASWGIVPAAVIGHSLGELTAACVAGVLPLDDALELVAARARLIDALPGGAMLAVSLPAAAVAPFLAEGAAVAAVNAPALCTVAGPAEAVAEVERRLRDAGHATRRLAATHAFHSPMVAPAAAALGAVAARMRFSPPRVPIASNLTGTWMTDGEAADPAYWARHLREPVRFDAGIAELLRDPGRVLVEVGPGQTLGSFVRQHPAAEGRAALVVASSLRHAYDDTADEAYLLAALGRVWTAGVAPDWRAFAAGERRRRVPLPTYPFQRIRHWVTAKAPAPDAPSSPVDRAAAAPGRAARTEALADWFHLPSWRRTLPPVRPAAAARRSWLVLADGSAAGERIAGALRAGGHAVTVAFAGAALRRGEGGWTIRPGEVDDYRALFSALAAEGRTPDEIVHLWALPARPAEGPAGEAAGAAMEAWRPVAWDGFRALAAALAEEHGDRPVRVQVLASGTQAVDGADRVVPEKALLLGALRALGQEEPRIGSRLIDVDPADDEGWTERRVERMVAELVSASPEDVVAWRGANRHALAWERTPIDGTGTPPRRLREHGVYLITGGLGRVGRVIAAYLAREHRARLVLTARTPLPERDGWDAWLAAHGDDDRVSHRIRAVRELEAAGAEVIAAAVDVADEQGMRALVAGVVRRWGRIDGVVHAAGVIQATSLFRRLVALTPADAMEQLRPKVAGARVLQRVLPDDVDFVYLVSSTASVLGGLGFGAYAAGNHFLDAFAAERHRAGDTAWTSVSLDGWPNPDGEAPEVREAAERTSVTHFTMTLPQACEAFRRVVEHAPVPHVCVAVGDLAARLAQWTHARPEAPLAPPSSAAPSTAADGAELDPDYAAPRDDGETKLQDLWQRLLGGERIGVHENFFELGGHSLLGTRLIARVRQELGVELPIQALFRSPTIAEMAAEIAEARVNAASPDLLAQALDEVLALSAEQVEALLNADDFDASLSGAAR